MRKHKSLTLTKKLMLGYSAVALITLLVGLGGYYGLSHAMTSAEASSLKEAVGQLLALVSDTRPSPSLEPAAAPRLYSRPTTPPNWGKASAAPRGVSALSRATAPANAA
jgi:hypothetical protein